MNRNKKTFTPNMRVAALYLLMGVLLLLAVTLFSGRESMRATEEYFVPHHQLCKGAVHQLRKI